MVKESSGITDMEGLRGAASYCAESGSSSIPNVLSEFGAGLALVEKASLSEAVIGLLNDECVFVTGDRSALAGERQDGWAIVGDTLSREPLAPVTLEVDAQWSDIVRWVVNGLVLADYFGVSKPNIDVTPIEDLPAEARWVGLLIKLSVFVKCHSLHTWKFECFTDDDHALQAPDHAEQRPAPPRQLHVQRHQARGQLRQYLRPVH